MFTTGAKAGKAFPVGVTSFRPSCFHSCARARLRPATSHCQHHPDLTSRPRPQASSDSSPATPRPVQPAQWSASPDCRAWHCPTPPVPACASCCRTFHGSEPPKRNSSFWPGRPRRPSCPSPHPSPAHRADRRKYPKNRDTLPIPVDGGRLRQQRNQTCLRAPSPRPAVICRCVLACASLAGFPYPESRTLWYRWRRDIDIAPSRSSPGESLRRACRH